MIVLSNSDVAELLPMERAIEVVASAMVEVSEGRTTLPLRNIMPLDGGNFMGMMPGVMASPACFGIKLVSLFPGNPASGFSSHQGAMILFEAEHGSAIAMMNADLLTAIRTAAASAVATRELARQDAKNLTIIGYGEQARHHLDAMMIVRNIKKAVVAGRAFDKAGEFAQSAQSKYPAVEISAAGNIQDAVKDADIVCTVTAATDPILFGRWLKSGCHLNVVGASIPSKREIDTDLVVNSSLYVDYRPSTLAQAGDVILALDKGLISESHIRAEIGDVVAGNHAGRTSRDEITLYRSLGIAAQDIAVAHDVFGRAKLAGIGITAPLD